MEELRRAKGSGLIRLFGHRIKNTDLMPHLSSELHGEVTKSAEPDNSDALALRSAVTTEWSEDGYAGAQKRRGAFGVHPFWNRMHKTFVGPNSFPATAWLIDAGAALRGGTQVLPSP